MKCYHKSLEYLHVGCEKPRSYFIPYSSYKEAVNGNRYTSEYYFDLNGIWNFEYYSTFEDVPDDFYNHSCGNTIKVPGCWQLDLDIGYDVPNYSNLKYPFPIDPPHVPIDNPCGHYRKSFMFSKSDEKKYFINFEGVSSCFYLYVNGIFIGYSQVSHCTSEFDIGRYLLDGQNTIDVLVVKWCDGSYLEDQDMFRLSGIFRDVYILTRNASHIEDVEINYSLNEDLSVVDFDIKISGVDDFSFNLIDKNGNHIYEGNCGKFLLTDPVLWNAESPYLYRLIINSGNEYIPFDLAVKKLEFRGNIAYFNNKPIKLYGINRHDSDPKTGYYTSVEHMLRDLIILKQANVNCIRTSHYPNSPLFLELCSRYGFMVVDEADIETHGMGFEYRDTWDWYRWSALSTLDEWEEAYVDRAVRLYERDKNFGCVIMWSLGNESGCGKNHRAMRNYIKSRNKDALVHYENSHLEFKAVPVGENFSDISDCESRMYSSLEYTEEYAKNKNAKKPFYFCEFSCSMSTGDIQAHVDLIRKYPVIFGGCFWELTDHAVEIGDNKFRYGGDFGDYPNDDICCVDGIVFPDRRFRPGFYDLKKAYEPFECKFSNGVLTVFNRRFFTDLNDCYLEVKLENKGETVWTDRIDDLDILPQSSRDYVLNTLNINSDCLYLNVLLKTKNIAFWSPPDYEVGFNQFDLSSAVDNVFADGDELSAPEYNESGRFAEITANGTVYTFDKSYGRIAAVSYNGNEIISDPIELNIWKAPGNNEIGRNNDVKSAFMDCAVYRPYDCMVLRKSNSIQIICNCSVGGPAVVPVINGKMIYEFLGNGKCNVTFKGDYRDLLKEMNMRPPKFGFRIVLDASYKNMEYFGKGPFESYQERHYSQKFGRYKTTVYDNFVPYIFPMENGAHFGTRYAYVLDESNKGILIEPLTEKTFIFNASPYSAQTLDKVKHDDELPVSDKTYVYADYRMDIRGGRGVYEKLEPERIWNLEPFEFGISFIPVEL